MMTTVASAPSTTTIRTTTKIRDRLNRLAQERGTSVNDVLQYLIDENWKAGALADAERFREQDPEGYREYLDEMKAWDVTLSDGLEDEPPYRCDDPEWIAAGGLPETETETEDAA